MNCADWPENPIVGQQFTLGSVTYTWDGEKWAGNSDIFTYDREEKWSSVALTEDPGNPTTHPANWGSSGSADSNWKAQRERRSGYWSPWVVTKLRGSDAVDSFVSFIFVRSNSVPNPPVGGSYSSPVPAGWYDGVPNGEAIVWQSTRRFFSDGSEGVGLPNANDWSPPKQMTDTATIDYEWSSVASNPGNPTTHPNNWSNTSDANTIWKAERYKLNGVWGAWNVVRIRGEDGTDGIDGAAGAGSNLPYTSIVFKRSATAPAKPAASDGDWLNPVPVGWDDGIPAGDLQLYQTQRIFTSNGLFPQDLAWTEPRAITSTSTAEYKWSAVQVNPGTPATHPNNWTDVADPTTVWQAFRQIINGVVGAWQITKIKGESGDNVGRGFNFFTVGTATGAWSDAVAAAAVPLNTPVTFDVVTIFKLTDPSVNVTKFWNGAAWELPANGGLFLGSIIVDGSVISRHLAASISLTTPRVNGGTLNGAFMQLFGDDTMIIESAIPFGPDNLMMWVGPKASTGNTPDTIAPVYTAVNKATGKFWIDRQGNVGIKGHVVATSGTFDNVTINENCTILGTLDVKNVGGVITKSASVQVPLMEKTTAYNTFSDIMVLNIAANPLGLDSTLWVSDVLVEGYGVDGTSWKSIPIEIQVLVNDVVVKSYDTHLPLKGELDNQNEFSDTISVGGGAAVGKAAATVKVKARFPNGSSYGGYIRVPQQNILVSLVPTGPAITA